MGGDREPVRWTRWSMLVVVVSLIVLPVASAVHFYRGDGSGCSPASGEITDDAPDATGEIAADVLMGHNTFHDASTLLPVTVIEAGQAVRWSWNSEHCHSVQAMDVEGDDPVFYSGFYYPEAQPDTPEAVAGLFHYPVPTLDTTLSYVHTFDEPGEYVYACEHHGAIGMVGLVIVT